MAKAITDIESFKSFIRDRTRETWDERGIPYYLSFVGVDLNKLGIDYHDFTAPLRLSQWVASTNLPDTKVVIHPNKRAKIALVPADVDFEFDNDEATSTLGHRPVPPGKRGRALLRFVDSLADLPDGSLDGLQVPARTLIALLKA